MTLPKLSTVQVCVGALLLVLYGSLLLHTISLPAGDDLPRLIKNGQTIFQNWDVLTKNVYSYTEPNHAFANHHWLSGIVFAALYAVVGFGGLVIFKTVVLLATLALLFLLALRRADFWLVALCSVPTIMVLDERTMVRPEIFSFFFIVVFLYILMDSRDNPNSNRLFWLIPLQVIWANMHLYFGVGVLLTAGMLAEQLVLHRKNIRSTVSIRKMAIVLLCIILASFMTPFGMSGAVFALKVNVLKDFPVTIAENQSIAAYFRTTAPWQDIPLSLFRPMVVVLAISFLFGFRKQEKPWFYACAAVGTAIIGLALVRATPFFAIMFLPALSSNLNDAWQSLRSRATASWRRLGVAAFILLIAALIVTQYAGVFSEHRQFGIGLVPQSNAAADFFKANNLRGPIFNDDDIGSYLIFHLYPAERVFVDNRFGDAYSAEFFRTQYLAPLKSDEAWKPLAEKYRFNALFLYHYDANPDARAFLYRRMRDPSWALVYADRFSVILLRDVLQNKPVIDAFHITRENAAQRLAFLSDSSNHDEHVAAGDLFNFIGRADLAHDAFSRVLVYSPNDGRVLRIMGEMESGIGDPVNMNLAKVHLERAIEVGEKTAEAYASLSYVYYMLGSFEKAEDAARSALRMNPENTEAIQGLELLLKRKSLQ